MKYAVIVEEGETSFGAHVPDLPGCVAVAETKDIWMKREGKWRLIARHANVICQN